MAGERVGKTYEAILKVVLDRLKAKTVFTGEVIWNETPDGLSVEPDFIIGPDKNHPEYIIMVTHFGSRKNSDMKCWRNLGELCEAKTAFPSVPKAINIVFDAVMKDDLKILQNAAFDGQLILGDKIYGQHLCNWAASHDDVFPVDQNERAAYLAACRDTDFVSWLSTLEEDMRATITTANDDLDSLWECESKRKKGSAPVAKYTYLRRGFTKRLLVGNALQGKTISSKDGPWLQDFGLVAKSISGYRITDDELNWFINTRLTKKYAEIAALCASPGFLQQMVKVRSVALLEEYGRYVCENLATLSTHEGMYRCLLEQHRNPIQSITVPTGCEPPRNVWIYDYISALVKADSGRAQSFGYASFSNHPKAKDSYIGAMPVGEWCTSFITQFFTRRTGCTTPENAIEHCSIILSEELSQFTVEKIQELRYAIKVQYIAKEYEATLLAHRGFEPLLGLLIDAKITSSPSDKRNIRTCFAEKAGLTGLGGKTSVLLKKHTIINWQTATDAGRDHKRKELCGRAIGLRYTWNAEKKQFEPRPGVQKLILLLDGTWRQKDLDALVRAGWDEIYYPDELDQLKKAIV